jgi:hypothetical protein
MAVRFQADADLSQIIVAAVLRRSPDIDFQTAHAGGLGGLTDIELLGMAASEERILVTHDARTMPTHFAEFVGSRKSSGVIVVPQSLAIPAAAEDLTLIWAATTPEEWTNRIFYLPL